MIEVVFSESARGSLKVAQHFGEGSYPDGPCAVTVVTNTPSRPTKGAGAARKAAEERLRREWENAVPLGGEPADVFGICVGWSMGDISDMEIGNSRRNVLEQEFSIWPRGGDIQRQIEERMDTARNALEEILGRSAQKEAVRIWYSHNPEELCGCCWLMAQLRELPKRGPVYTVRLPEWEVMDGTFRAFTAWGEIASWEWGRYLSLQQEMEPAALAAFSIRWKQLQEENAPLRVYLNGRLQSAPESIYDNFILMELKSQRSEFSEAKVIGDILGRYQLGTGDVWIALRIERFIREGMLEVVTDPAPDGPIYRRTLRKAAGVGPCLPR